MWTLHKLNTRASITCPDTSIGLDPLADPGLDSFSNLGEGSPCPWDFSKQELDQFPALRKRNFWCIQRHQARALHYDLRLQLDGGTISWAIPRGLIGISKKGESSRMAVQTSVHPISYTTHEGVERSAVDPKPSLELILRQRRPRSGRRAGTLLWDIGEYTIGDSRWTSESDSEDERRMKKRRVSREGDDKLGRYEEDRLRNRFHRPISTGKSRSIHFTLKGGRKMTNHSFILVLDQQNSRSFVYGTGGREKKTWFIRLPYNVEAYPWDRGGEEGEYWGRSVKTGRTFAEVCSAPPSVSKLFASELIRYLGWSERVDEVDEEEIKAKIKVALVSTSTADQGG